MMQDMDSNLLCADRVIKALPTAAREVLQVAVYDTVGSTNDVLREKKGQAPLHGAVVIADQQTRGRGRRGRRWCSPAGANLYCSVGWRFNTSLEKLTGTQFGGWRDRGGANQGAPGCRPTLKMA
jgi:BirA family biotin operon repressor/biotin-[acetyl-CoA-carboxylase] ligase